MMRIFSGIIPFLMLAACGGSGNGESPRIDNVDSYEGTWVSKCTSSFYATGYQDIYPYFSFIETIYIGKERVSSEFQLYKDTNCLDLDEISTSITPMYGGKLIGSEYLVSDNGYPYRSYNTLSDNDDKESIDVSLIDGVLYRVYADFAVFESNGKLEKNVIFEWSFGAR